VRVYNYAHVEPGTMSRAEQETTRIYCEIGVETLWLDRPISEVQQDSSSYRISDIYLNIVPRATGGLRVRSNSLGIAPGAGPNRGRLYVCDDRVESPFPQADRVYNPAEDLSLGHRSPDSGLRHGARDWPPTWPGCPLRNRYRALRLAPERFT